MIKRFFDLFSLRGWTLLGLGILGSVVSLLLGQNDLLWVTLSLVLVTILAAVVASRSGIKLTADRSVDRPRASLGDTITVTMTVHAQSAWPFGLLQFEESLPRELGRRPRFAVHTLGAHWTRTVSYALVGSARGRYTVGPLLVRSGDPFGLAHKDRQFQSTREVLITPRVVALDDLGSNPGSGETGESSPLRIGLMGKDDVMVREYRNGDDVRRIHWRSTARKGEIMVRREEQSWDPSLVLALDSRLQAHAGVGKDSSFEWAVSAAASIAAHVQRMSFSLKLVDATGLLLDTTGRDAAEAHDAMLLTLTDVGLTRQDTDLSTAARAIDLAGAGDVVIAIVGRLGPEDVKALQLMRAGRSRGYLIVLDVDTFTSERFAGDAEAERAHRQALALLANSDWRLVQADSRTPVDQVWAQLGRSGQGGSGWTPNGATSAGHRAGAGARTPQSGASASGDTLQGALR